MATKKWSLTLTTLFIASAAFGQSGPRVGVAPAGRIAVAGIPYYDDGIPAPIGRTDEDGFSASGNNLMGGSEFSDKAPKPSADPRNFEDARAHREMLRDRIFRTILETRLPYNDEGRKLLQH